MGGEYGTSATYMSEIAAEGPARVLRLVPVRHADRRSAPRLAGADHPAELPHRPATHGLGLAHPIRDRRRRGGGRALPALVARRDRNQGGHGQQGFRHLRGPVQALARLLRGAGLHGRRLAELLHLHHLHAEVSLQHGAYRQGHGLADLHRRPVRLHDHPAVLRLALGPDRPQGQHAAL